MPKTQEDYALEPIFEIRGKFMTQWTDRRKYYTLTCRKGKRTEQSVQGNIRIPRLIAHFMGRRV